MASDERWRMARVAGAVVAVVGGLVLAFFLFMAAGLLAAFNPTPRERAASGLLFWAALCCLVAALLTAVGAWRFRPGRYPLLAAAAAGCLLAAVPCALAWRAYPRIEGGAVAGAVAILALLALAVPRWRRAGGRTPTPARKPGPRSDAA